MRALDAIGEFERLDQQALDEYAKLFGQRLSEVHVQALAALFKWSIPEDADLDNEEVGQA